MAIARRSPIAAAAHAKGFVLFCNPIEEHPSILPGPNTERGESSRALAAVSNFSPPGGLERSALRGSGLDRKAHRVFC